MKKEISIFLIGLLVIGVSVALAGGGGEGEAVTWKDWLWRIINFGILLFLLYLLISKFRLKDVLTKRSEGIEKAMRDAEEAKELAQKALQEVEERLKLKDKETEDIIATSRRSGEEERDRLIKEGDRVGERILEQVRVNIEYELRHAREAIKAEAVEIAMGLAEKRLKEGITKEEQERLLEESLERIEDRGN